MYGQTDKIFNKIMEKSTKVKLRFFCQVEFESGLTWKDLQFHLLKKKKIKKCVIYKSISSCQKCVAYISLF